MRYMYSYQNNKYLAQIIILSLICLIYVHSQQLVVFGDSVFFWVGNDHQALR